MNLVYVAAWYTGTPKMVCLLDIISDKHYKGTTWSAGGSSGVLVYREPDFKKYSEPYKKVARAEFEAEHGRINYP